MEAKVKGQGERYVKRHAKAIVALSALLVTLCIGVTIAGAAAPLVTMGSVSDVSYTSAHVTGEVDPQDNDTYYYFQYTANPEEGWSFDGYEGPLAAGSGAATVQRDLTGLKPGTEYFVRLVANNFVDGEVVSAEPFASFTTDPVGAPSTSIDSPSSVTGTGAHFSGTIDPEAPSGNPAAYDVNWRFECTPECPGLSGTIAADDEPHTVEADATGLLPGTAYEVTLVAENAAGPVSAGPETFTTSVVAPTIQGVKAGPLYTEAELLGAVNPGGGETTYRFEYGQTSSYGKSTAEATIPAGSSEVAVSGFASGLQPGAEYHFRLVASNSAATAESGDLTFVARLTESPGEDSCPNAAVRAQQGSARLPECRAYEQVSPVDKHSSDVMTFNAMSSDGEAVAWFGLGAYADPQGPGNSYLPYVGRRVAGGWQATNMAPEIGGARPGILSQMGGYSFSNDLSTYSVVTGASFDPADQDVLVPFPGFDIPQWDIYRIGADRQARLRSHNVSGPLTNEPVPVEFGGTSSDGTVDFFATQEKLDPSAPEGVKSLYRNKDGEVELVSRDENGLPLSANTTLGAGTNFVTPGSGELGVTRDSVAVSPDGGTFVYSSGKQVYVHRADGEVRIVSRSQRDGDGGSVAVTGARFAGATPDLRKIVISSRDQLTDDSPSPELDSSRFYLYDVEGEELTYIGPDSTGALPFGNHGLVKISDTGNRIYYIYSPEPVEGPYRLYVWSPSETREIGLVGKEGSLAAPTNPPSHTPAYLSANGNRFVFQSERNPNEEGSSELSQVYLYDYASDETVCLSCGSLSPSVGSFVVRVYFGEIGFPQPRVLTSDGTRAIFTSGDSLLPSDSNAVDDAYEWVMSGHGDCTPEKGSYEPASKGCLYLISAGDSPCRSRALAISPDGSNVFVQTRSKLALTDTDNGLSDIYAARVRGGSLVQSSTACAGDACQESSGQPPRSQIGSASFQGGGNPKAKHKPRCRRKKATGKQRRGKTKCVKQRKHNSGRAK